ncbi:hypothetical protein DKX38_001422 [Salix brachista]|uniref:Knottin scorpion toxin-like domain-containing protein n=1 Tax=Salix brachista TaxID=2182728 RepID=A0A5N5P4Q3_9ROSI|nr:hypothetical protein DKX38_001422 [Salix brachista]
MASSISFTRFFTLILLFSAALVAPHVNGQKRCVETLYKSGCTLTDCGTKCYQKHGSARGGQCIANPSGTDYACVCVYDCNQ